jgi:hypothetical protein
MKRVAVMLSVCAAAAGLAACGDGGAAREGAVVNVYVAAELCAEARSELAAAGGEAGALGVRARCLRSALRDGGVDLATVGANARRATEDSTAVAVLLSRDPTVADFATPILESAQIPWTESSSAQAAMASVLDALESADNASSLRSEVSESLGARP